MHPFVEQLATFVGVVIALLILGMIAVLLWKGVVLVSHIRV